MLIQQNVTDGLIAPDTDLDAFVDKFVLWVAGFEKT
jgi:hypothetical protein